MFKLTLKSIVRNEPTPDEITVAFEIQEIVSDGAAPEPVVFNHALPIATTADELKTYLRRSLATYEKDREIGEATAKQEAANKSADELKEAMGEFSVTSDEIKDENAGEGQ